MGYGIVIGKESKINLISDTELNAYLNPEKVYYRKEIPTSKKYSLHYGSLLLTMDCKEDEEDDLEKGRYIYINELEAKFVNILKIRLFFEFQTIVYNDMKKIPCIVLGATESVEKEIVKRGHIPLLRVENKDIIKKADKYFFKGSSLKNLFYTRKAILTISEKIKEQKEKIIDTETIDTDRMQKLSEEIK